MIFWALIGTLTALSLLVLIKPLAKKAETAPADTAESDLAVYKDQLKEIDKDLKAGNIAEAQAEIARIEIQRRILNAGQEQSASTKGQPLSPNAMKGLLGSLIVAFPIAGLALYMYLGQPGIPGMPLAERDITAERMAIAQQQDNQRNTEMMALAQKLQTRLENEPQNLEGWMLLGSTYAEIGQFPLAEKAFRQAMENNPPNPMIFSAVAEMMVAQAEGQVSTDALELFRKTLELNPRDPRGLFYSGLALTQAGANEDALKLWLTLRTYTSAADPWLQVLDAQIVGLANQEKMNPEKLLASYPAQEPTETAEQQAEVQPGPSSEDMAAAAELSAEERTEMINGMVERLADRLSETPDDLQGWIQLARSYHTLDRSSDALEAIKNAEMAAEKQPDAEEAREKIQKLKQELGL
ncbi:c-type cytochrome biogenesis protein CcmI [Kiloniella majae]|uniref:c-type cytochrome biogenesis protein CcmI n=1 Tax=Kiloniella majae TaxID=1938558 RepID=UPI000A27877E|nr:c-type cytochrome biogenesis protein CcmI [Kiloniella majae]